MFESLRYRIATYILKKAQEDIDKGGFNNLSRSLDKLEMAMRIVPVTEEYMQFRNNWVNALNRDKRKFNELENEQS